LLLLWVFTLRITTKQLRLKAKQLEIKNKEIELATAKLIHSEKLALLGTISASIAHQLNSPLGAILNSAERILRKGKEPNAELIKRSAEYSKQLVQKFLNTSRSTPENEKNCSEFSTTFNDWLMLFKDEISKRQIEIKTELTNETKKLPLKKSELFEIISNLMFNARDAIASAGKEEKQITVRTFYKENIFALEVEDTGTGFDEKIFSVIFEPFQTTKGLGKGTGLGMWVVKKLVDNYNGKIELLNTEKGALVRIEFPTIEDCN
jgi:C4-dicarboxylate-specific signal transduction histidine kinase